MIQIEAIMGENEISKISEGLREIGIGGLTVFKAKGRGKTIPKSIHAELGTGSIDLNSVIDTWFCLFCQLQKWTMQLT